MFGMRGCEPCLSCMGLGVNKGIKIFESMFFAKKPQLNSEQLLLSNYIFIVISICRDKNF